MGALLALVLSRAGYTVFITDPHRQREWLVRTLLDVGVQIWRPGEGPSEFDLAICSAPTLEAVHVALDSVKPHGVVFFFSGIHRFDQDSANHPLLTFDPDLVHREARYHEIQTVGGKPVKVIGSSGYYEHLARSTADFLAENAAIVGQLVTGVVLGLNSQTVHSLSEHAPDLRSPTEDSPVLAGLLTGQVDTAGHLKIAIVPDPQIRFVADKEGPHV